MCCSTFDGRGTINHPTAVAAVNVITGYESSFLNAQTHLRTWFRACLAGRIRAGRADAVTAAVLKPQDQRSTALIKTNFPNRRAEDTTISHHVAISTDQTTEIQGGFPRIRLPASPVREHVSALYDDDQEIERRNVAADQTADTWSTS